MIDLPTALNADRATIQDLQQTFYKILPQITLTSETAKREFLIAPILLQVAKLTDARIYSEYPLEIDDRLSGSLDYLLRSQQQLLIIEAKKGDLDKGFNQLAAELIALDQELGEASTIPDRSHPDRLYGAITLGEIWRFAILDSTHKQIIRDLHSYRVPEDLEALFQVILGILTLT